MNRRDLLQVSALLAAGGPALAQMAQWKPRVLDTHQNDTIVVLTELIIPATDTPGTKAAQVNRYIDLLLADGAVEERYRFLQGLAFLDSYAIAQHQQPFVKCTVQQQTGILEAFDSGADPAVATGHAFFRMAKQLTSRIYYATEIGFKELNKGGRVPANFAGCQ